MKNMNELSELKNVKAPDGLRERTLSAAREARREDERTYAGHAAPHRRRFGAVKRFAAAACALALALGGWGLWQSGQTGQAPGDVVAEVISNSFGIVAYAADTGETMEPNGGRIVFAAGSGANDGENGFFSGCLLRVTGGNIATVSASIDRGGLYRVETVELGSEDELRDLMFSDTGDTVMGYGTGPDSGIDRYFADIVTKVENGFTDSYDPDVSYGLWAEPKESGGGDMAEEVHGRIDEFDGAELTVTVTFTDGTSETQTMTLHTGRLAVEYVDGEPGPQLTGEVLADGDEGDEGYVYGVYAELN